MIEGFKHGLASELVAFHVQGDVGILTIRNGSQNTIPSPYFLDVGRVESWVDSNRLKSLVFTGFGRNFSAGADVKGINEAAGKSAKLLAETLDEGKDILDFIAAMPIITVAAIGGACFGAGLEIALACNFRISGANALFAFPESNIGIMPGLGGTFRLPALIGHGPALEFIVSGRVVGADEAMKMRLVDRVVPAKTHLEASVNFLEGLVKGKDKPQISSIIKTFCNWQDGNKELAMKEESRLFAELASKLADKNGKRGGR